MQRSKLFQSPVFRARSVASLSRFSHQSFFGLLNEQRALRGRRSLEPLLTNSKSKIRDIHERERISFFRESSARTTSGTVLRLNRAQNRFAAFFLLCFRRLASVHFCAPQKEDEKMPRTENLRRRRVNFHTNEAREREKSEKREEKKEERREHSRSLSLVRSVQRQEAERSFVCSVRKQCSHSAYF